MEILDTHIPRDLVNGRKNRYNSKSENFKGKSGRPAGFFKPCRPGPELNPNISKTVFDHILYANTTLILYRKNPS